MIVTKRKIRKEWSVYLYTGKIWVGQNFTFLEVMFDKLTWKGHINKIKTKCKDRMNLIQSIAGNNWGAAKNMLLLLLDRALIRSVLDYGGQEFNLASKPTLCS